jgi:hypothetical protein
MAAFMITASSSNHFIKSQEDLKSKHVSVICGQSAEAWIKKDNIASKISCTQTMADAVDLVAQGHVDAALGWMDELHFVASRRCNVELSAVSMHATEFAFPVSRRDNVPNWRYSFNAALFQLRETGEFHKLRKRWFHIGKSLCSKSASDTDPEKAQIKLPNVIGVAIILSIGLFAGGIVEIIMKVKAIGMRQTYEQFVQDQQTCQDESTVDVNPAGDAVVDEAQGLLDEKLKQEDSPSA